MCDRSVLCITANSELAAAAGECAAQLKARLLVAADPQEVALLLAEELSNVDGVIVDFDSSSFAAAWVRALGELDRRPTVVAVSVYHPRFLEAAAHAEYIRKWIRRPANGHELANALGANGGGSGEGGGAR